MKPREELDLILSLIRKYNLPLSPILEYAVNEKKEEYPEEQEQIPIEKPIRTSYEPKASIAEPILVSEKEEKSNITSNIINKPIQQTTYVQLTRQMIEKACTPDGDYTKEQLEAIGVPWPAPDRWIEQKIGTFITPAQLEKFYCIEYEKKRTKSYTSNYSKGALSYKDIAFNKEDEKRLEIVLRAMQRFYVPTTPRNITQIINRTGWKGIATEDTIDTILKRLPEVEYIPWGKYILKSRKK